MTKENTTMKLSNEHIKSALEGVKYYKAGIPTSYDRNNLRDALNELYMECITSHLISLIDSDRDFQDDAEVDKVMYRLFKYAFKDAERKFYCKKNTLLRESFSGYDEELKAWTAEDAVYNDEVTTQLNTLETIVSEKEFNYLHHRINLRLGRKDAAEALGISERQAIRLWDNVKSKTGHLHNGIVKYEFLPYGETSEFKTIEEFFYQEFLDNQYVGAVNSTFLKNNFE